MYEVVLINEKGQKFTKEFNSKYLLHSNFFKLSTLSILFIIRTGIILEGHT